MAEAAPMFAAVVEAPAAAAMQVSAGDEVVVELGDKLRLRIGPDVPPARVAALIKAMRSAG